MFVLAVRGLGGFQTTRMLAMHRSARTHRRSGSLAAGWHGDHAMLSQCFGFKSIQNLFICGTKNMCNRKYRCRRHLLCLVVFVSRLRQALESLRWCGCQGALPSSTGEGFKYRASGALESTSPSKPSAPGAFETAWVSLKPSSQFFWGDLALQVGKLVVFCFLSWGRLTRACRRLPSWRRH